MESEDIEFILDHYKNPRNYGILDEPDASYEEGIPSCGDLVRIDLTIADNMIKEIKFSGSGCAISQASVSILTEQVIGKKVEEIISLTDDDALKALGGKVSPIRFKCALLGFTVLKKALLTKGKGANLG